MNKKSFKIPKMLFIFSTCASAAAVIFRMILTAFFIEPKKHALYETGSILPTVFHILLLLVTLASIFASFKITEKKTDSFTVKTDTPIQATGFFLGILLFIDALSVLFIIMEGTDQKTAVNVLEFVFALSSAIFFMGSAFKPELKSLGIALTSLFPVAWCAVCLIRIYFDHELLMTDPGRILRQIAFLSAMIALLCEPRERLGIFNHRFFLAATAAAPVLILSSAVPEIFFGSKLRVGDSDSIVRCLICTFIALHFIAKLHAYVKATEITSSETPENEQCETQDQN